MHTTNVTDRRVIVGIRRDVLGRVPYIVVEDACIEERIVDASVIQVQVCEGVIKPRRVVR